MAEEQQQIVEQVSEDASRRGSESVSATGSQVMDSESGSLRPQNGDTNTAGKNDDDEKILYEAELDLTSLEKSQATAYKLNCISALIVAMAAVLFILSFPFSLFLILFCFDTKRSCLPFQSILDSPWRLFLTNKTLHCHLPTPPQRPYINAFYCLRRTSEFSIPLVHIKSVATLSVQPEGEDLGDSITNSKLENIVFELKPESPGVTVPVSGPLGLWSRKTTIHSLVIYSVKEAGTFIEKVQPCLNAV